MLKPTQGSNRSYFTVRSAMQVTLLAAALALAGCSSSDGSGGRHADSSPLPPAHGGGVGGGGGNGDNGGAKVAAGPLEGAFKNTGGAVDNAADLGLEDTLGGVGKQLDGPLKPVYSAVESTTQSLGAQTGLGQPVDGTLQQVGDSVAGLGDKLSESGLPGGLDKGTGALVTGIGSAVSSAGGLLNQSDDNPHPLAQTLADATGGVRGLTQELTGQGGLLQPLSGVLNDSIGGALGPNGKPILQPTLANAGQAVDQVLPLGLQQPLGGVGKALDGVVSPAGGAVTQVTQTVGDSTGLGAPVNQLLTSIGGNLQQVTGGVASAAPLGLNGVVANLGASIGSAGGLVHKTPGNANPLGNTLDHATKAVAALTGELGVTNGSQKGGGLLGGADGALAPVTGLLGGITGKQGGDQAKGGGPLAPVTGVLNGGLLGGGDDQGSHGGLLGGLLGGLTGGLGGK